MNKQHNWTAFLRTSAEQSQFRGAPLLRGEAFRLHGDVGPSVQVFFQPVAKSQIAPIVFLGIYVEEFERQWLDRLRQAGLSSDKSEEDPPFALLAGNVDSLRPRPWVSPKSPSSEDITAMQEWFDRVFAYAKRLPISLPHLISAIGNDDIAGEKVWAYLGHPVKVRGFVQWLHRTRGVDVAQQLLPHLVDRTEPYDVNVMLDDPNT